MSFTFFNNTCLGSLLYKNIIKKPHNNPFVGSLFVNDTQFVKFCLNLKYYMSLRPVFSLPKTDSVWAKENGSPWYNHPEIAIPYPVMFLGDIEIHWIHENDTNALLLKYYRRMNRYKEENPIPFFILSNSQLLNDHEDGEYNKMIESFISLQTALYLSKYEKDRAKNDTRIGIVKEWLDAPLKRRPHRVYTWERMEEHTLYFTPMISDMIKKFSHH